MIIRFFENKTPKQMTYNVLMVVSVKVVLERTEFGLI